MSNIQSPTEAFKEKLEALLVEYPTVKLNVLTNYTIQVTEVQEVKKEE